MNFFGFIMQNLDTIAGITIVAVFIMVASSTGVWGELAKSMMETGTTGSRAAGNVMLLLGFLSFPVAILGAAPTGLWLYLRGKR